MSNQNKLNALNTAIETASTEDGLSFTAQTILGDVDVLQVTIEDREEFPIYITIDDSQILCVTHLWRDAEVKPDTRNELMDALLSMNVPMPLSSFSKIGDQYIIFGALAQSSAVKELIHEIEVLSDNTLEAVEAFSEYLK